jgi:predicted AAA+ superfamily ATPase
MYQRKLDLSSVKRTFFLWGQRQTGKSSLLKSTFGKQHYVDLLKSDEFLTFSQRPETLRERLAPLRRGTIVILDEVQKVPQLLDEVHSLIEDKGLIFGLAGSSARKLKRGRANLLGGRARRYELRGFSAAELDGDFNLVRMLTRGYLPAFYLDDEFALSHRSYVGDYLKEEVLAEGLTRNLPVFSRFLETAALADTEILNFSNIGREVGVSPKTAAAHYEVLVDTLIGSFLPAYVKRMKRRTVQSPKFYFHEVGIVNSLSRRSSIEQGSSIFGKAFENWVFHELQCFLLYAQSDLPLSYWKLTTEAEVDFVLGSMEIAIEAKSSERVSADHLKGLRELKDDFPRVRQRVVVCLEKHVRVTEDGIWIVPFQEFIRRLWSNPLRPDVSLQLTDGPSRS